MPQDGLGMTAWELRSKKGSDLGQLDPFGPFPEGINHGRIILNEVREINRPIPRPE